MSTSKTPEDSGRAACQWCPRLATREMSTLDELYRAYACTDHNDQLLRQAVISLHPGSRQRIHESDEGFIVDRSVGLFDEERGWAFEAEHTRKGDEE